MTNLERLARAVLMLHKGGRWTGQDRIMWTHLTGEDDLSPQALCAFARKVALEEFKESLGGNGVRPTMHASDVVASAETEAEL